MASPADQLLSFLRGQPAAGPVAVAWSGGVDSTVVAVAAQRAYGGRSLAVVVRSPLFSGRDRARVAELARELELDHSVVDVDLLEQQGVRTNAPDRCYWCKKAMFAALAQTGAQLLLDGTNASDDPARPGLRAVSEAGAVSPLRECGLGKAEVRALAAQWNLPVATLPSDSCLATRVRSGAVTVDVLERIEAAEDDLRALGFSDLRVALDDLKVIVEVPRGSRTLLERHHERIRERINGTGAEGWSLIGYGLRPDEEA